MQLTRLACKCESECIECVREERVILRIIGCVEWYALFVYIVDSRRECATSNASTSNDQDSLGMRPSGPRSSSIDQTKQQHNNIIDTNIINTLVLSYPTIISLPRSCIWDQARGDTRPHRLRFGSVLSNLKFGYNWRFKASFGG